MARLARGFNGEISVFTAAMLGNARYSLSRLHGRSVTMSDVAAVNEAVAALAKAMVAGDRAQMAALTAEQLSYGHSNGLVETKAQFIENIAGGHNTFSRIDLSDTS